MASTATSEVTRVAREVGVDGKLGGQAEVPAVAGSWKGLTDSVNSMANNLTSQVRNIAQVTTAVAKGDLSQKITVDARGEILLPGHQRGHHRRPDQVHFRRSAGRSRRAQGQHQHDGPLAAGDHRGQPAAGLAADQPGPGGGPDAGPARPRRGRRPDHERAHPARRRSARRVLPGRFQR